jgi:hypothetical protein
MFLAQGDDAMVLGLVLSVASIVLFVWAMFRLAVLALPVGLGFATFLWAIGSGPGVLVGMLLGLVVGVAVFLAGQMVLASRLPDPVRIGVALLFAVPAGIAGHSVVSGVMSLGGAGPTATTIFGVIGGFIVAGAAVMSLLSPLIEQSHARAA